MNKTVEMIMRELESEFVIMEKEHYYIISEYFSNKNMDRMQLERVLNFETLTMEEEHMSELLKKLDEKDEENARAIVKRYVHFVKNRSTNGVITWEALIARLKILNLAESPFGIRVQRFSNNSYWEIFFNHFVVTEYENGEEELSFDNEWYLEAKNENAYEVLSKNGIEFDDNVKEVFEQISNKWDELSNEEIDEIVSAIHTIFSTQYVDKSKVNISKSKIKNITMSGADLVPEVGLRDYLISFENGDSIYLRF